MSALVVVSGSVTRAVTLWGGELARLAVDVEPDRADIKPGWVALVIVLALAVLTALLWLSMRKQLAKVRFEEQQDTPRRRGGEPPAG